MDKIVDLIASMVSPGKTWGYFFRKTLSTILVVSIGAFGFNTYQRLERSHWEDLPLHTAIKEGGKEERVNKYLQALVSSDDSLKSVWLYSWPDARTLLAVAHAGHHIDPLPLGYFLGVDAPTVGELVLGRCDCLGRPNRSILACPIITENDSWGVIVFEHNSESHRPDNYKSIYVALAHKLANLIYHNDD